MNNNTHYCENKYSLSRNNSNENEWNSFDQSLESLLGERPRRGRTFSASRHAPSPSSTHSDQQPQQVVSPQPIPVIGQSQPGPNSSHVPSQVASSTKPISVPSSNVPIPLHHSKSHISRRDIVREEKCHFCPSPTRVGSESHTHDHRSFMFSCAACGETKENYDDISRHVQDDHVGDDMELVLASINIPEDVNMLKEFQCGIKSCSRRLIGGKETDLLHHIR